MGNQPEQVAGITEPTSVGTDDVLLDRPIHSYLNVCTTTFTNNPPAVLYVS
jgi:hypothetical protein